MIFSSPARSRSRHLYYRPPSHIATARIATARFRELMPNHGRLSMRAACPYFRRKLAAGQDPILTHLRCASRNYGAPAFRSSITKSINARTFAAGDGCACDPAQWMRPRTRAVRPISFGRRSATNSVCSAATAGELSGPIPAKFARTLTKAAHWP